jgi:hypothetical protein
MGHCLEQGIDFIKRRKETRISNFLPFQREKNVGRGRSGGHDEV